MVALRRHTAAFPPSTQFETQRFKRCPTGVVALKLKLNLLLAAVIGLLTISEASAQSGIASVYSTREQGSRTASGVRLNDGALTAAHRSLPFGSKVRVTNKRNGKSVVVTI